MYSDVLFDYIKSVKSEVGIDRYECLQKIKKERYEIRTDEEVEEFGKPKGKYELISIPEVLDLRAKGIDECVEEVVSSFKSMIGDILCTDRILIVGLGNRHISPDSLGAKVVGGINVTFDCKYLPKVMAIAPSVMGLTGIETVEIVQGVVDRVKPTHIILIDSLCAGAVERLGKSIQITNTGICPGGGIGNKRKCIGADMAKHVFSIGIPLLIYSSTFVRDIFEKYGIDDKLIKDIMQSCKKHDNKGELYNFLKSVNNVVNDDIDDVVVSIKDIEECVEILSKIISKAINIVLGVDGINDV